MLLCVDIIVATPSHEDEATIDFTYKERIEITVDVGCASPRVSFTWSRPGNIESSSKPCSGNPYFNTSKSIFRIDNPTRRDEGPVTLSITHPKLESRRYTWNLNLKCK